MVRLGDTHGLSQDEQGRIYVAHTCQQVRPRGASPSLDMMPTDVSSARWREGIRGGATALACPRPEGELLYHWTINRCKIVKTTLWKASLVAWLSREDGHTNDPADLICSTTVAFDPNGDFVSGDGYGPNQLCVSPALVVILGEIDAATGTANSIRHTVCGRSSRKGTALACR